MRARWSMLVAVLLMGCEDKVPEPEPTPEPTTPEVATEEDPAPEELVKEDLVVGEGPVAEKGDRVKVHYTGRLLSTRAKFDSSHDRDEPFEFTLGKGQVIEGWDRGVVGMKVGGKRKLTIPSDLAYGEKGKGDIPPDAALLFEVELLGIEGKKDGDEGPRDAEGEKKDTKGKHAEDEKKDVEDGKKAPSTRKKKTGSEPAGAKKAPAGE